MSSVIAAPELITAAATDLANIGSTLSAANSTAAAPTTGILAAAEDEVSAAIASLFSSHGTAFQALSAQAAAIHAQFVQALNAGARAYASTEAANAGPLQTLTQALPVPNVSVKLLGRTLIQSGTAHTSGVGLLEVAVGANTDATINFDSFSVAFALGAGSDATVLGSGFPVPTSAFNSAIAVGTNDVATAGGSGAGLFGGGVPGTHDHAFVLGTGSTADAGFGVGANGATSGGNNDIAAVLGNMHTATATGANHLVDIVTPFGTAGGAAGMLVPNVASAEMIFRRLPVPNVAVSVFGHPLVQLGTAHATSGLASLAVAVGANSDATAPGLFHSAFALGAGSDANVITGGVFAPDSWWDTAIAVGTNDVAVAGDIIDGGSGSFDTAFVVGTGSTADAGAGAPFTAGSVDLAAVFGNMQTATATGDNFLVDIVTPFGTL